MTDAPTVLEDGSVLLSSSTPGTRWDTDGRDTSRTLAAGVPAALQPLARSARRRDGTPVTQRYHAARQPVLVRQARSGARDRRACRPASQCDWRHIRRDDGRRTHVGERL